MRHITLLCPPLYCDSLSTGGLGLMRQSVRPNPEHIALKALTTPPGTLAFLHPLDDASSRLAYSMYASTFPVPEKKNKGRQKEGGGRGIVPHDTGYWNTCTHTHMTTPKSKATYPHSTPTTIAHHITHHTPHTIPDHTTPHHTIHHNTTTAIIVVVVVVIIVTILTHKTLSWARTHRPCCLACLTLP